MSRTFRLVTRPLIAVLLFAPTLGWTAIETVTANRTFEGRISVQEGRRLADGQVQLVDEFEASGVTFEASMLQLATTKEVNTSFVLRGRTKKGRPFGIRLVRPGTADVDLGAGSVTLHLPLEVTLDGKTSAIPIDLSTDAALTGPKGLIRGRRMSIRDGSSPVVVVGSTSEKGSNRPDDTSMLVAVDGIVTAVN